MYFLIVPEGSRLPSGGNQPKYLQAICIYMNWISEYYGIKIRNSKFEIRSDYTRELLRARFAYLDASSPCWARLKMSLATSSTAVILQSTNDGRWKCISWMLASKCACNYTMAHVVVLLLVSFDHSSGAEKRCLSKYIFQH